MQAGVAPEAVETFVRASGARTTALAMVGNVYRSTVPIDVADEIASALRVAEGASLVRKGSPTGELPAATRVAFGDK